MLYKKYHRNFIRKFKAMGDVCRRKVVRGFLVFFGFICIEDNRGCVCDLVFPGGQINKYLHVIQKIS